MEASSSSPSQMTFDVFISFRGGDTRNTFTGFLYEALCRLGIMTFMDDKKLLIGDDLNEKLVRAIEESRYSIVVLSEDYASSKWCLKELAKIMNCMTEMRRILPVFYYVDPSDVRHLSGDFQKSFDKHKVSFKESFDEHEESIGPRELMNDEKEKHLKEVQQWRDAMKLLGNLSGVVVTKDSSEVDIINKITNQISDMLQPRLVAPDRLNNLFEIIPRSEQMNMLLGLESNDVHFVGIVGMGGIGKTTIAEVVYDNIAPKFRDNSCFLRISECNLVSLQHQLLSRLFKKEDIKVWDEDHGAETIKNRLSSRKVLIVLDGIKEKTQLEKLAGSANWFGPKSRVIITTRNRDILRQPNYKDSMREYNVELLPNESAISLFRKHAFGDVTPGEEFMQLIKKIVDKVKGHPLALIKIGSFMYGKSIDIWEEELKSLTNVHNEHLFNILKISFDGLGATSQQIFLDLACFFNGKKKDRVIEILESFGYRPHSEIQLLCDRCLIEVRHEDTIFIPSLIQAMGQKIEREADRQSRFWLQNDVLDVFDKQQGVKHIQGIVLDMDEKQDKIGLEAKLFKDMTCLRILEICNVQLCGDITHLSKQLRLLNWHGYPSKFLPLYFESRYLFELLLPVTQTTQLWKGQKRFEKLKVIDASDSKYLRETPDFTEVPNLERLVLRNCTRLKKMDSSSINRLNRLVLLDLRCCVSLKISSSNINSRILILSSSRP